MAVQAQYPSNVLLRNRNVQEGKPHLGNEYSLQQEEGTFLDHTSHMLFNNITGNNNLRKRARGVSSIASQLPVNLCMPIHQQQQNQEYQFLNLSELHNQPLNFVSTGLQLVYNDHRQQQFIFQKQNEQQSISPQSSVALSMLTEDLSSEIKQQRDEIEHFIHVQGDDLCRTLIAKRQKHYCTLLGLAEESLARRIREKVVEIEKVHRKNDELEAKAAQLITEAQFWQAKAKAQEAAAVTLQAELQHAMVNRGTNDSQELLECVRSEVVEDAESACHDPGRVEVADASGCKACGKRVVSVVLLPCRHLCICAECDGVVQACPVCLSFRSSSIHVVLA